MKFKKDKLIHDLMSGFTRHQPRHANFKIIHHDSEEKKPCHVENDTKTIIRGFLSQAGICIYTIILIKTSPQKFFSELRNFL